MQRQHRRRPRRRQSLAAVQSSASARKYVVDLESQKLTVELAEGETRTIAVE
jgi:hypothetical protein